MKQAAALKTSQGFIHESYARSNKIEFTQDIDDALIMRDWSGFLGRHPEFIANSEKIVYAQAAD